MKLRAADGSRPSAACAGDPVSDDTQRNEGLPKKGVFRLRGIEIHGVGFAAMAGSIVLLYLYAWRTAEVPGWVFTTLPLLTPSYA